MLHVVRYRCPWRQADEHDVVSGSSDSIFSSWWRILYLVISVLCLAATVIGMTSLFSVRWWRVEEIITCNMLRFIERFKEKGTHIDEITQLWMGRFGIARLSRFFEMEYCWFPFRDLCWRDSSFNHGILLFPRKTCYCFYMIVWCYGRRLVGCL